jgi:uncharacterized protein YhhL (DUF1145 family)
MVKRCFECDAFTTQKCGRCDRKCCNDHLYHATTGMTAGPASEVCWKCADEGGMVEHRAFRVLIFCNLASLCFWVLYLLGITIPLDFFFVCVLWGSFLLLFCWEEIAIFQGTAGQRRPFYTENQRLDRGYRPRLNF